MQSIDGRRWIPGFVPLLLALLSLALAPRVRAQGDFRMIDLGTLTGNGTSAATAINDAGQITGNSDVYDADGNYLGQHAFLYSNGQMIDLGTLGTDPNGVGFSSAAAINGAGQVAGNSDVYDADGNYLGQHAFLYSNGQMTDLGTLGTDPNGVGFSSAAAINGAGQVAGNSDVYDADGNYLGQHAFLYSNGQMTDLGG